MTKKITAVVLALVMVFSCMLSASAAWIEGATRDEAAIASAKSAYLNSSDTATEEDEYYNGFAVTRSAEKTDEEGDTYFEVTVRSKYAYKYTCDVYYYKTDILGEVITSGYRVEAGSGELQQTNVIMGLIGYIIDQIMGIIDGLI